MGGDTTLSNPPLSYSTEESYFDQNFPGIGSATFLSGSDRYGEVGLGSMDLEEFARDSSNIMDEVDKKRTRNVYMDVLKSYEELQFHKDYLKEAKNKILSYTPGSWIEEVGGMKASDYDIPKKITLLLIGPRGSGKSSLVNKISRVLDDDPFTPERAQVSYSSVRDGTHFLHEYTIPKGSSSFCLYDTPGLSDDLSETKKVVERWMTKGVRHGKLIMRDSDDASPKSRVRRNRYRASEANVVNCVIFVVSAVQILQSMDSGDETKTQQTQTVATTFNYPVLSFKDEKPIVVLTHGDLLSPADRTLIRMYLGQLLGIHPKKQIFDIPGGNKIKSDDFGTRLTILNMLRHCLEHADKNLPFKKDLPFKDPDCSKVALQMLVGLLLTYVALVILFGMGMMLRNNLQAKLASVPDSQASQSNVDTDWHATIVDSVPNLQPEAMQPHANFDFHASEVDFVRDLHPEAHQSDENLDWGTTQPDVNMDCHASEVDSVGDLQPEVPQSDEIFDWGAIRHLWSD